MRKLYMMKCGHANNASQVLKDGTKIPACVICGCTQIDHEITDPTEGLEGRIAKCGECSYTTASKWNLAFFKYCPEHDCDEFYCGCRGWD